jgi:hypothetical protein
LRRQLPLDLTSEAVGRYPTRYKDGGGFAGLYPIPRMTVILFNEFTPSPGTKEFELLIGLPFLWVLTWLLATSLLHGMFILLFALSTRIIMYLPSCSPSSPTLTTFTPSRRGLASPASLTMLFITTFCFVVATVHLCAQFATLAIVVRSTLINITYFDAERTMRDVSRVNMVIIWAQLMVRT